MNFKAITLKAAALAALSVAGVAAIVSPSQAAILAGDTLDVNSVVGGLVKVQGTNLSSNPIITGLDFGANGVDTGSFQVTGATGGFTPYLGNIGTIQDVTFVNGISGFVDDFMSINPDLLFDLSKATVTIGALVNQQRTISVDFFGTFTNALGEIQGTGLLTTQLNLKTGEDLPSSFSITSTAVPTPALLPSLLALGAGVLRKRKAEAAEEVKSEA